jgi:hypothetical protein
MIDEDSPASIESKSPLPPPPQPPVRSKSAQQQQLQNQKQSESNQELSVQSTATSVIEAATKLAHHSAQLGSSSTASSVTQSEASPTVLSNKTNNQNVNYNLNKPVKPPQPNTNVVSINLSNQTSIHVKLPLILLNGEHLVLNKHRENSSKKT